MRPKIVYILHKNGANSHYLALAHLLKDYNIKLAFREFGIFTKLYKSLLSLNFRLFLKQFVNLYFMFYLVLTRKQKVILGIAPYDTKLKNLLKVLKGHQVYYHTSWTCWDKTFQPKNNFNANTLNNWKNFIENSTEHIFAVTEHSKIQILENYNISKDKISVVNHALGRPFLNFEQRERESNSFIYIGRLVPQKGLDEILEFFKINPSATFTIVGRGKMEKRIREISETYSNIIFVPYLSNKSDLVNLLRTKEFLISNSKKTEKWEELFGITIIEAMSQGVIPLSTDHSGPKEIITSKYGYLVNEGEMCHLLEDLIANGKFSVEMSQYCIKRSKDYNLDSIALKWQKILEP